MRHFFSFIAFLTVGATVACAENLLNAPASRIAIASPPLSLVSAHNFAYASTNGQKVIAALASGEWVLLSQTGAEYSIERSISLENDFYVMGVNSKGAYIIARDIPEDTKEKCQLVKVDEHGDKIDLLEGVRGLDLSTCGFSSAQLNDDGSVLFIAGDRKAPHSGYRTSVFFREGDSPARKLLSKTFDKNSSSDDEPRAILTSGGRGVITMDKRAYKLSKGGRPHAVRIPSGMSRKYMRPFRDQRGRLWIASYGDTTIHLLRPGSSTFHSSPPRVFGTKQLRLVDDSGRIDGVAGATDFFSCIFGDEPASEQMDILAVFSNGDLLGYEDLFDSDVGRLVRLQPHPDPKWSGGRCQIRDSIIFHVTIEGECTQYENESASNFYGVTEPSPATTSVAYFDREAALDLPCTVNIKAPVGKEKIYAGALVKVGTQIGSLDENGKAQISSSPRELCGHSKIQAPYMNPRLHPFTSFIECFVNDTAYPANLGY